jgi:hypothetical protein
MAALSNAMLAQALLEFWGKHEEFHKFILDRFKVEDGSVEIAGGDKRLLLSVKKRAQDGSLCGDWGYTITIAKEGQPRE